MYQIVKLNHTIIKKIIAYVAVIVFSVVTATGVSAEEKGNALAEKGYVGNVGMSITPCLGWGADISTSHGYSFGNGLWMGGGLGVSFASEYDGFMMPFFTEVKHTFMRNDEASPFVDCKLGCMTNFDAACLTFTPSFGVDIGRFSVFAQANILEIGVRIYGIGFCWNFR